MPRLLVWAALAVAGAVCAWPAKPAAQPIDQWHYIDTQSVLFSDPVAGLHGAGIIQSDQIFALLYLGLPGDNGVITVVLPTPTPLKTLTSTLIATSGTRFDRDLGAEDLDIARVNGKDIAYSFPITDADVELFKSSAMWELRSGDTTWQITLRGSRRAITRAEQERARMLANLETQAPAPATAD